MKTDQETIQEWFGIEFTYDVVYFETLCDFSYCSILIVFKKDEEYYLQDDFDEWNPVKVSEDKVLESIIDFESYN